MTPESQSRRGDGGRPSVVVVAGSAGSGKTTLGLALAARLQLAPLDLDSLTNPLLDRMTPVDDGHWLTGAAADRIREGRYAALRRVAADLVSVGLGAVLIAPFTEELRGGAAWVELLAALTGARIQVLYLHGDEQLFAARRAGRGAGRDAHRPDRPPVDPVVEHHRIDARLSVADQVIRARQALGTEAR